MYLLNSDAIVIVEAKQISREMNNSNSRQHKSKLAGLRRKLSSSSSSSASASSSSCEQVSTFSLAGSRSLDDQCGRRWDDVLQCGSAYRFGELPPSITSILGNRDSKVQLFDRLASLAFQFEGAHAPHDMRSSIFSRVFFWQRRLSMDVDVHQGGQSGGGDDDDGDEENEFDEVVDALRQRYGGELGDGSRNKLEFLVDRDRYTNLHEQFFCGDDSQLYVCLDSDGDPLFLIVQPMPRMSDGADQCQHVRVLVITSRPYSDSSAGEHFLLLTNVPVRWKDTIRCVVPKLPAALTPLRTAVEPITGERHQQLVKDLLHLEITNNNYKFALVYCAARDRTEADMLGHNRGSAHFDAFAALLGDIVELRSLRDTDAWSGGLDTQRDAHGRATLCTNYFRGCRIVWHVSTMIRPRNNDDGTGDGGDGDDGDDGDDDDDQMHLFKKRHIGNDIVVLIFRDRLDDADQDESQQQAPIDLGEFRSQFNHVYVIVQVVDAPPSQRQSGKTFYRVEAASRGAVHSFVPPMPADGLFKHGKSFRNWLLTKLINSERTAMYTKRLAAPLARDRRLTMISFLERWSPKTANQIK
jgi:Rap/ran-GAP